MPGIICSTNDLIKELDNFIWLHRLSDAFDQLLRYSYPAHLSHKFVRDFRYISTHVTSYEMNEGLLMAKLRERGYPPQQWTPPFVGVLGWLLNISEKDRFAALSELSVGHTEILITEFCRKERLDDHISARLRHEIAYDAVPHDIYRAIKDKSVQPEIIQTPVVDHSNGAREETVDCNASEQQRLEGPRRSVLLKPRTTGISKPIRCSSHKGEERKSETSFSKQTRALAPHGKEQEHRRPSSRTGVEARVSADRERRTPVQVKSESSDRTPQRAWWQQYDPL